MDEKLPYPSPEVQEQRLQKERISRRTFMMNVGIALNAAVGVAIAVPVVAYLLGPVMRKKDQYLAWVDLGDVNQFKPGETKLIDFRNPFTTDWDGETANLPAYVRSSAPGQFRSSRSTARIWAVRCAGFRSRSCSCAPATAVSITPMAAVPPVRRSVASLPTTPGLRTGIC